MNIDLDGEFLVAASRSNVYAFLTDPRRFAPLLPYFRSLDAVQDDRFELTMEIGVPQVRGAAKVEVLVVERKVDHIASYRSIARPSLGVVESDLRFELSDRGTATSVVWRTSSKVRGNLASIAAGILAPLAKRNVASMIDSVQAALGRPQPATSTAQPAPISAPHPESRFVRWLRSQFRRKRP